MNYTERAVMYIDRTTEENKKKLFNLASSYGKERIHEMFSKLSEDDKKTPRYQPEVLYVDLLKDLSTYLANAYDYALADVGINIDKERLETIMYFYHKNSKEKNKGIIDMILNRTFSLIDPMTFGYVRWWSYNNSIRSYKEIPDSYDWIKLI